MHEQGAEGGSLPFTFSSLRLFLCECMCRAVLRACPSRLLTLSSRLQGVPISVSVSRSGGYLLELHR